MINLLTDYPRTPDAPEPLESAWTMSLTDLHHFDRLYMARLLRRDVLTHEENRHWADVTICLQRHDEARRHSYFMPY